MSECCIEIDYSLAAIHNYCVSWELLCEGETPALVHAKVDIERAILRLNDIDAADARWVQRLGEAAFKPDNCGYVRVPLKIWGRISRRLFQILNTEGTY